MSNLQAIVLGLVQGLTEFLPVSSSGHLVIAQNLIPGFSQPGILFDVILHFATLFAVLAYFRLSILKLESRYLWYLAVGTVPAVIAGIFFKDAIEAMFLTTKFLAIQFFISGIINFWIDAVKPGKSGVKTKNSLVTGIAQAISIIPAISRSGATILSGVAQKVEPKKAVEFSFLLSVPAILGANILQIASYGTKVEVFSLNYLLGFAAAFISGFFAIGFVFKILLNKKFKLFGYYCILLGVLTLFFN